MPEVVNPNNASTRGSVEQALASANARIDSLQAQLKDTQKSLEDLSKFVRNDNLKSWAEHKVTEVAKTSQSIAEQAKSKVMQWVQAKTGLVLEAVQGKVNEVKTFAQDKVSEVKTAAQNKVNEVKTVAQGKVNEVKTAAQDKVNEVKTTAQNKVTEVKTAAQLKGIEFKESVREQANKFLAPVNSAQVERAAKHIVREFGDGKSYNKAATHSFQLNDKNELSVARQSDGAVIYQKGALTTAANSHDILKLNALPTVVNQIKEKQNAVHPKTTDGGRLLTNIVLYQIPSSEIEFLFHGLNHPYYWNPAHSHLMRWDLRLTTTDMAIASNPLSEIADLTGDIILDGLLDDGINSKLCHQIVNAFREQRNQTLYLVGDRFDCPHKLFPFVNIKQWQLPDSVAIANFLKQKSIYCDAVYRASLGLYIGELNNVLQMYANLQG